LIFFWSFSGCQPDGFNSAIRLAGWVLMRPNINYKVNDNLAVEAGANIFFGDYPSTFFGQLAISMAGQFRNNTNIYTALRYSFCPAASLF